MHLYNLVTVFASNSILVLISEFLNQERHDLLSETIFTYANG